MASYGYSQAARGSDREPYNAMPAPAPVQGAAMTSAQGEANPQSWNWQPYDIREEMKKGNLHRKCRDMFWAIAFIVVVVAMMGFAGYGASQVPWTASSAGAGQDPNFGKYVRWITFNVLWASLFGIVFAYVWNLVMRYNAGRMIKLSIYVSLGLQVLAFFGVGIFMFTQQSAGWIPMAVGALMILLQVLYYWCVWKRIPFSEQMLKISTARLSHYWQLGWIALGFGVLSAIWCFIVAFAGVGFSVMAGVDKSDQENRGSTAGYMSIPMVFVLYWGGITLSYILHAVACGVMGTWYFGTSRKRTIRDSLKRAFTFNLGSMAFGAAIVAAIKTLKYMASQAERDARRDGNAAMMFLMCCARCILQCIGDIINYINHLAIVRVAVYGESFLTAAKRTFQLFKYRGLEPLINDDLSNMPVWLGCLVCWIVCIPVNYLMWKPTIAMSELTNVKFDDTSSWDNMHMGMVWGFSAAFALCASIMAAQILTVVSSFVQALYVCWADDPAMLDQTHPQEAARIKEAVMSAYGIRIRYDDNNMVPAGARL